MKKHLLKQIIFLGTALALIALTGCTPPKRPLPSDTITGRTGSASANARGDMINQENVYLTDTGEQFQGRTQSDYDSALNAQAGRGILGSVYFDLNQYGIKASERPKVEAAKAYLDENPNARLLLEGHCDWRGTTEYNMGLGDRRASGVRKYLQDLGVPASRIETVSQGDLQATENADEGTMAKDRRVEFVVKQ